MASHDLIGHIGVSVTYTNTDVDQTENVRLISRDFFKMIEKTKICSGLQLIKLKYSNMHMIPSKETAIGVTVCLKPQNICF